VNSAGLSPYSSVSWSQSPMSSPAAVSSVRATSTPRSIHVYWKEPLSNGSRILSYNVDVGDPARPLLSVDADMLDCNVTELMPETTYKSVVMLCSSDFSHFIYCLLFTDTVHSSLPLIHRVTSHPEKLERFTSSTDVSEKSENGKSQGKLENRLIQV